MYIRFPPETCIPWLQSPDFYHSMSISAPVHFVFLRLFHEMAHMRWWIRRTLNRWLLRILPYPFCWLLVPTKLELFFIFQSFLLIFFHKPTTFCPMLSHNRQLGIKNPFIHLDNYLILQKQKKNNMIRKLLFFVCVLMSLTASSMQNKDSESRKEIELREVKDTVTHDVVHSKYHTYIIVFLCFTGGGNIF